jgi:hypothetical protein
MQRPGFSQEADDHFGALKGEFKAPIMHVSNRHSQSLSRHT